MSSLLKNRPILKKAILYSLPALLVALTLRAILTYYYPYAYWSKDSFSFMDFAQSLFLDGQWDLDEKRRYTYPLFLTFSWLTPFPVLVVLPIIQHLIGLTNVILLAWVCLRTLRCGKIFVIPLTILLAIHGDLIAYEHAILAEFLATTLTLAALAGWIKWRTSPASTITPAVPAAPIHTSPSNPWWHLIPFSLLLLLKPSMQFLLPGWALAIALSGAWRSLRPAHYITIAIATALCLFTMGKESQGWRLLLTTAFPGLQVEGSRHPELVAQAQPLIDAARANLRAYHITDKEIKLLTEKPALFPQYPAWAALDGKENQNHRHAIYRTLILESLRNDPLLIPTIALWRMLNSSGSDYTHKFQRRVFLDEKNQGSRDELLARYKGKDLLFQRLYGIPPGHILHSPTPHLRHFARGDDAGCNTFIHLLTTASRSTQLTHEQYGPGDRIISISLLPQLYLLLAGLVLIAANKHYRTYFAPITLAAAGYFFFTYAIGSANPRFYSLFIPLQFLLYALPLDMFLKFILKKTP